MSDDDAIKLISDWLRDGADLDDLAREASEITGGTVVVFDAEGQSDAYAAGEPVPAPARPLKPADDDELDLLIDDVVRQIEGMIESAVRGSRPMAAVRADDVRDGLKRLVTTQWQRPTN